MFSKVNKSWFIFSDAADVVAICLSVVVHVAIVEVNVPRVASRARRNLIHPLWLQESKCRASMLSWNVMPYEGGMDAQ